jgi:hypothetical protein
MTAKRSVDKNRARTLRAALESVRYSATGLIEFLDKAILTDATSAEIDQLVEQLGGGDQLLIEVLDDALDTLKNERNDYVLNAGLELGDATFKVK